MIHASKVLGLSLFVVSVWAFSRSESDKKNTLAFPRFQLIYVFGSLTRFQL